MSRVGKQPIKLPDNVNVTVAGSVITASGPKGNLEGRNLPGIKIDSSNGQVTVSRQSDEPVVRARHGLIRSLVANMVSGVNDGFERKLEISGVGYRVSLQGQELKLNLGFSHDVIYKIPAGVNVSVEQNTIAVSGINKQQVGQVAAEIRALRPPEPYKGKGIKYVDEQIIRKSGKSGKETV